MKKKIFVRGYLCGVFGGIAATILFVLMHIIFFIYVSGLDVYLEFWDYPKDMVFVGVVISFIPSGLSGVLLAYLVWNDFEAGKLSRTNARFKGGLIGLIGVLAIFGFVLVTPLAGIFFRMGGIALLFLLFAFISGWVIGRWTGSTLSRIALEQ